MANRLFNIASLASAILLLLLLIAWYIAGNIQPRKQFLTLSHGCHVMVNSWNASGSDTRIEFFNNGNYGPYHGSIIGIVGPIDIVGPNRTSKIKRIVFGDTAGIYYRHFVWPTGEILWTLSVSLLYPLAAAGILPSLWLIRRLLKTRTTPPAAEPHPTII